MMDDTIGALITRVACGDTAAFDELYRLTAPRVLAAIQRKLVDPAQSEEVAQEVFLEVWQNAARFAPDRGQSISWILTMATRRAIDRVRATQASRDRERRAFSQSHEPPRDQVWEHVQVLSEIENMHRLMDHITDLQREAIIITYLEGNSIAEAAGIVGASQTAMKARIRQGMIGLREAVSRTSMRLTAATPPRA